MQILEKYHSCFLSIFSGIILILIFPRFNVEILAWIALVPLFLAINDTSIKHSAIYGFIAGVIFYFFGLHWIINTVVNYGKLSFFMAYPILALLASYLAFYISLFCALCQKFSKGKPLLFILLAPWIWTVLEYVRSTPLEFGFSWLGLGYSQYKTLNIIQIADITGVYGVSALIVWVNGVIYFLINKFLSRKTEGPSYKNNFGTRLVITTVLLLTICLAYGSFSISKKDFSNSTPVKISLIQGNIKQTMKWDRSYQEQVIQKYIRLTLKSAKIKPDMVVWPEASTPFYFNINEQQTKKLKNLVDLTEVPLLFGSPFYVKKGKTITMFNSAYFLEPGRKTELRYDKIHLVPFGEFVPMQRILFFVEKLVTGIGNFGRGDHETLFRLGKVPFGVSICYEIIFPDLVRRPVKAGAKFLVNITNDAWFGKSAASDQHFSIAVLRAVENRVPIVRAANTGISGMVDITGKLHNTSKIFEEAVIQTRIVPGSGKPTAYTIYGDWFCWFSLIISILLVVGRSTFD